MVFKTIYEAMYAIQSLIQKDNNSFAVFEWDTECEESNLASDSRGQDKNLMYILKLVTYNPSHKTHFLLHSLKSDTKLDALEKMYNYMFQIKKSMANKQNSLMTYSIEWYNVATKKTTWSHFYGSSIEEIMSKFYYGKTSSDYTIFKIKLNPNN